MISNDHGSSETSLSDLPSRIALSLSLYDGVSMSVVL